MTADVMRKLLVVLTFGFLVGGLAACEEQSAVQQAGEAVDSAAEQAGDAAEQATTN
jgi:hypothetical protein